MARPIPRRAAPERHVSSPAALVGTGQPNPEKGVAAADGPRARVHDGRHARVCRAWLKGAGSCWIFSTCASPDTAFRHLLQSAKTALDAGQDEKVVIACPLHDISNGAPASGTDHGCRSAQLVAPYVSEEAAGAVQHHQALRYFADESAGFAYPDAYNKFFGPDYKPPEYICQAHEHARNHRWYMTSRLITIYDVYAFQDNWNVDPEQFTDIIGRHFKQPREGLGFDGSPVARMWRTMIWPNNFLVRLETATRRGGIGARLRPGSGNRARRLVSRRLRTSCALRPDTCRPSVSKNVAFVPP